MSPSLSETQALLWRLITAPEGAAAGLAQLAPAERARAESLVRADQRLSVVERIDIYANMYFFRIRDCLKEDFVALHAVIGETNFHNLITDYLVAHPPSHFSLRYAGQLLPAFLGSHRLSTRWPYLADLAALEWSITEAFDARDAAALTPADLAAIRQEQWPALRFQLSEAVRLLDLGWPVHDIWRLAQAGADVGGELRAAPTRLRVWRRDLRVFHGAIDATEYAALSAIGAGAPFARVCEAIIDGVGEGAGTERAFQLLGEWTADELFVGLSIGT